LIYNGADHFRTGGCIGVDAYVTLFLLSVYPNVKQTIILPSVDKLIDPRMYMLRYCQRSFHGINVDNMPEGTTYRDRNHKVIVDADEFIGFDCTGNKRSGTRMSYNIAMGLEMPAEVIPLHNHF
jgi:hypothetical protein